MPGGYGDAAFRMPVCSAVEDFVRRRHLDQHKQKISRSKSLINNSWSVREETKLQTSRHNAKKEQVLEDRFSSIERENMRLLSRMQEIEQRSAAKAAANLLLGPPRLPPACQRSASLPASGIGSKMTARVRELQRIDAENQRMLKRLQGAKPSVNMKQFDDLHKEQQRYMKMRCEIPKDEWLKEREKESSAIAINLARKAAERTAALLGPEPESIEPPGPTDAECRRLLHLQDNLRRKMENVMADEAHDERQDDIHDDAQEAAALEDEEQISSRQQNGVEGLEAKPVRKRFTMDPGINSIGGVIPEHSKNLVEQLLAEYAKDREDDDEDDVESAAANAKAAAFAAFRQAEAIHIPHEDLLGYDRVIRSNLDL